MPIIDIERVDFNKSNITFVNGLTLERVKIKYNWLLNAKVKDAIIGENERGIVWYFGDWICGEWVDGTWYSGNFYDGVWKNGLWYSFKLNKFDIVNEKFFINQTGNEYSQFHNGKWLNGIFYGGTFGINSGETWENFELYTEDTYPNYREQNDIIGGEIQYTYKNLATWMDGIFEFGDFYDSIWNNGQHIDGYMKNSKWINGRWFFGTFDGDTWHNGYWYNGEFIYGSWLNGTFTKLKDNLISRFGNTLLNTTDNSSICRWYDGVWKNGEWFSGYETDINELPINSIYNYLSIWFGGTWENGIWYGGHFKAGTWLNGTWKNGVFGYLNSTDWVTPQLVSQEYDPYFLGSKWIGDSNTPTITRDSNIVTTSNTANTYYEWSHKNIDINITNITRNEYDIQFAQSNMVDFYADIYNTNTLINESNEYDLIDIMNNQEHVVILDNTAYTYKILSATLSGDTYNNPYWVITLTGDTLISDYRVRINGKYITTLKIVVKEKIKLESDSGSGLTYWDFSTTISTQNISSQYKIYNKYNINNEDTITIDILYNSTLFNFLTNNSIIYNNLTYDILKFEKIFIDNSNNREFIRIYLRNYVRNMWDGYILQKTDINTLDTYNYNIYSFNNDKRTIDIYSNWYGVNIYSGDTLKITPEYGGGVSYIYVMNILNVINEYDDLNIYRITYDIFPTGYTYTTNDEYINVGYSGSFVSFIGSNTPSYKIGDYVYIEQTPGYINSEYNGIAQILNTGITSSINNSAQTYYVTTSKKYRQNSTNTGKMVKYLGLYHDRLNSIGPSLTLQNIDFGFDFVTNIDDTKINGYSVKYDNHINNNNCSNIGYSNSLIYLPLKNLLFSSSTSENINIYNTFDSCKYGSEYRSNYYTDISEGKVSTITNLIDGTNKTNYLGGVNDLWGIENLKKYYDDDISYDPSKLETANSNMRISLQFMMSGTISQQLFIKNIQIKAFYSDISTAPIWENGTWIKGTWCNGTWNNGNYLSGLWIEGVFNNGNISSDYR